MATEEKNTQQDQAAFRKKVEDILLDARKTSTNIIKRTSDTISASNAMLKSASGQSGSTTGSVTP